MMPVHGRPFLDYVLSALADAGITDAALVVAPEHAAIRQHYERDFPPARLRVSFVVQRDARGTADAVVAAERWCADEPFLTLNADNLYPAGVLAGVVRLAEPGLPVFSSGDLVATGNIPAERIRAFALVTVDEAGYLTGIIEKPQSRGAADQAHGISMNCWRFDARIFAACRDVPRSARGEYELPEAVGLAVARGVRFRCLPARGPVLDMSTRADAQDVQRRLAGITPAP